MTEQTKPNPFRDRLCSDPFIYGAEIVTTRGYPDSDEPSKLETLGQTLAADPRIDWISVTDNPGGNPMLPADWLARILADNNAQPVIHLTCKDLNRNGLESAAWRYAAEGFHNILVLTGDYPITGYKGKPNAVFDLDSVSLTAMLNDMNHGLQVPGRGGKTDTLPPTDFFIGCAVSPFKKHEAELMPQYFKLARKIQNGAHWIIPQLGFDMRKFHEIKLFMQWANLERPVIGNVYILNKAVAGMFNRKVFPGCIVTDGLLEKVQKYAAGEDKGRGFFQELAAKQLAIFKGMGFSAGYLAGTVKPENFFKVIDMAESYGENDWKDFVKEINFAQPGEFYLFEQDPETGLGIPDKLNPQYLQSLKKPEKNKQVTLSYRFTRKVHDKVFTPGKGLFPSLQKLYAKLEKKDNSFIYRSLYQLEKISKSMMFGCKDCGDCSLPDTAYLCPRTACSKTGRNGPCGGSHNGRCELDDKLCIWARAYQRLKYYGESEKMLDVPAVFHNGDLEATSSWANTFAGRDHHKLTVNGQDPEEK